jgi:hypothetical protein
MLHLSGLTVCSYSLYMDLVDVNDGSGLVTESEICDSMIILHNEFTVL